MPETHWKNTYDLDEEQYEKLESAEEFMDMMLLEKAEQVLWVLLVAMMKENKL